MIFRALDKDKRAQILDQESHPVQCGCWMFGVLYIENERLFDDKRQTTKYSYSNTESVYLFVEIFHIMGEALRWSSRAGKWGLQGDSETAEEVQMQTFDCQRKLPHTCTNDLCVSARMCIE